MPRLRWAAVARDAAIELTKVKRILKAHSFPAMRSGARCLAGIQLARPIFLDTAAGRDAHHHCHGPPPGSTCTVDQAIREAEQSLARD